MTPAEAMEYMESLVVLLHRYRPELLRQVKGAWSGPHARPEAPVGIWFEGRGMSVCVSPWDTTGDDSGLWLHVSISRPDRDPDYRDLTEVRDRFFRATDTVLHVWPPRSEHFSLHDHCLHLWTPMDGSRPIPDLRGDGGGV